MRSLRSRLRSPWLSGLLTLISLLGVVDLHPALHGALGPMADSHGLAGGEAGIYFPAASHPGQPVHFEAASPAERPHCAACFLRVQTRGTATPPAAAPAPALPSERLAAAPDAVASRMSFRPSGARAPPFS